LRPLKHHGRAVRRNDFCLLTSSYEYPRLVGSRRCHGALAPRVTGNRLIHVRAARFGGGHTLSRFAVAEVFRLPSQRVATEPLVSLSRLPPVYSRSRGVDTTRKPPRSASTCAHERHKPVIDPRYLSSCKEPSPRNALSSVRLRTSSGSWLCRRETRFSTLFSRPVGSCEPPES
jgi:hypothetical protein